ncbi:carbohydrate-binding module family 20 domain-containing protein [Streptantibioticus silvisoli]|uniref:Alpha-amylase n=1 Tax=Streptantibioticus silvisoli TaxID=2705255 RepID=A0ABT6W540_9ACTN|nr:carbohydrate-binding module family 20 domain-containing protein [Streptantibioticus silvisoli]MDI5965485.1 carbohydrate-binding module family 20 domain-containing protein [Streptantibioticus silvisoli]
MLGNRSRRRPVRRTVMAGCAAVSLAFAALAAVPGATAVAAPAPAVTGPHDGSHDVSANLFEWNWPSVASECADVLGPDGYGSVEVAPPQDSISVSGHPWWEVYQPTDYNLTSRMGDAAQFQSMVTACHNAGVKVIVDAVINHMTGQGSASYGGASFTKYDYPGIYQSQDFHHYPNDCGNSDGTIHDSDWTSSTRNVWNCELVGLADLNTGSSYVQGELAGYLNSLTAMGVDGFRVDSAKQIDPADLAAIESRLTGSPQMYQEVIYGADDVVQPSQYYGDGDVLDFQFGIYLKQEFGSGNISALENFGDSWSGMNPSDKALAFVTNHDTERNGNSLSYKDGADYTLANVFMLAWNYGTPQVYSGFTFNNSDDSPPADSAGHVTDTSCGNGWTCFDRDPAMVGMVGWHNAVGSAAVGNWWSDGSNRIAFSRGSAGFVAINKESGDFSRTFATGLPAGTYCDVVHGTVTGGTCDGPTVTVDSAGDTTADVPGMSAVAIDADSLVSGGGTTPPPPSAVNVDFKVNATTTFGQNVYVTGSVAALGGWDTGKAIPLSSAAYPVWDATVQLPADTAVQYKYIMKNPDGSVTWESGDNNALTTGTSAMTRNDTWH